MKRGLIVLLVVLALIVAGIPFGQAQGVGEAYPSPTVTVFVEVTGLGEGDNVTIYGGQVPKDENSEILQDSFKLIVGNGLTPLPIHEEGLWEVSAGAVDYGEIPETYEVPVQAGKDIVLKFRIGKALPILGESLRLEEGTELGLIGYIQSEDGETVLMGKDGRIYYKLESDRVDLSTYVGKKLWVLGTLKQGGGSPYLKIQDVVDPGQPIWRIDSEGKVSSGGDSTCQLETGSDPEIVDEVDMPVGEQAQVMTASDPPQLKVLQYNVGGSDGKIDVISTLDEGEKFWNFDQVGETTTSEREHAVSMLFYGNAEVDKVKDIYWGITAIHYTRYDRLNDDSFTNGWEYDQDKGTRENELWPEGRHMRVYAPYPEDYFFDLDLGYFVIGTVHYDDWGTGDREEWTENSLCSLARDKGYTVYEDYCYIGTEDSIYDSNGYVSYVLVEDWVSPTGHNDPSNSWSYESYAYDDDTDSRASTNDPEYLELTHSAIVCDKVRIYAAKFSKGIPYDANIDIDVYYGGAWHNIFSGYITKQTWVEKAIGSTQSVTAARVKCPTLVGGIVNLRLYEFDFNSLPSPPYAWVSPTGHDDPSSNWAYESNAYDDDTGSGAFTNDPEYLELTHSAILCDKVRIYAAKMFKGELYDPNIDIDVYYGEAWHNIFSGTITKQTWVEKAIGSTESVTKARVRCPTLVGGIVGLRLYEFDFNSFA